MVALVHVDAELARDGDAAGVVADLRDQGLAVAVEVVDHRRQLTGHVDDLRHVAAVRGVAQHEVEAQIRRRAEVGIGGGVAEAPLLHLVDRERLRHVEPEAGPHGLAISGAGVLVGGELAELDAHARAAGELVPQVVAGAHGAGDGVLLEVDHRRCRIGLLELGEVGAVADQQAPEELGVAFG